MKNWPLLLLLSLFCSISFCDERLSDVFKFDGSKIDLEDPLLISPNDQLTYSSALAQGDPQSLALTVHDQQNTDKSATLFFDDSQTTIEGTLNWNYTDKAYEDFPTDDPYTLKETIITDLDTNIFIRTIAIMPEPTSILLLSLTLVLYLRRKI